MDPVDGLLFDAAFHGNLVAIDAAVAAGGNVNAVVGNGSSVLYSACFADQLAAIDALLAHGADPNLRMTYRSPVDGRVEVGLVALMVCHSVGAVERLLAGGADPNVCDNHGSTPLMRVALAWVERFRASLREPNATELHSQCHALLALLAPESEHLA